ncbi:MAG: hypothetical protein AB7E84_08220 [Xanthobacteraceae bacterium]
MAEKKQEVREITVDEAIEFLKETKNRKGKDWQRKLVGIRDPHDQNSIISILANEQA